MKHQVILFGVVVVIWAMLAAFDHGKIGLFRATTEAADLENDNGPSVCELKKGKEFIEKKRLNAQEWTQKGMEHLESKKYEDARKAFDKVIEINEGFLQLFNRAAVMHIRYGNQKQANDYLKKMEELESNLGSAYYYRGLACRE